MNVAVAVVLAVCFVGLALIALTAMVLAHTPKKSVAEIIRDAEAR